MKLVVYIHLMMQCISEVCICLTRWMVLSVLVLAKMMKPLQVFIVQFWKAGGHWLDEKSFILVWHYMLVQSKSRRASIFSTDTDWQAQSNKNYKLQGRKIGHTPVIRKAKSNKGKIQVAGRDNADVRRGDRRSWEKCPHYVHDIHTRLCRRHETKIEEDKAFGNGCWMGRGEANTSTGGCGSTSFRKGRDGGLEICGQGEQDQTTCKSKSEVQPPLKIWEIISFKTNETEKKAFLGFCENT